MKKLLIFANPFLPSAGIGTKRISKFVKYLPANGWEPIVVAPKIKHAEEFDKNQDYTIHRVPIIGPALIYDFGRKLFPRKRSTGKVSSVNNHSPKQGSPRSKVFNDWLFIPDQYILWGIFAAMRATKAVNKDEVEACFATGPSFSSLIAGTLYSKFTGKKLYLDFRDPWIGNEFIHHKTKFHYKINAMLEKFVVKQAERVISVAPALQEQFQNRYPQYAEKFIVINNGYDLDDIPEINSVNTKKEEFTITHTGTFYGEKNPGTFLQALHLLKLDHSDLPLKVKFVGGFDDSYKEFVEIHNLSEWVEHVGFVPYLESMKHQAERDTLLLIPGPGLGTVTGKFYEYLSMKKPILCIGLKNSNLERLLNYTDSGIVADAHSPQEIKQVILDLVSGSKSFSFENIEQFRFDLLTEQLIKVIENQTIQERQV
jgi:glycosyltransferase involved in cell wall biosynthesis